MKIGVIGTGYVGLCTGAGFAEMGNDVMCMDIDQGKIENLRQGILPIYEPGLNDLVDKNIKAGRLSFSSDLRETVERSDVIFIAVGTPSDIDGSADLKFVLTVAEGIGQFMNSYKVIVNKSTVPMGTGEKVRDQVTRSLALRKKQIEFDVVSNPEFLKEGAAVEDFLRPDRVVVGTDSDRARKIMERVYEPFLKNNNLVLFMDIQSAEMTKFAANAMLATKISFMNEIARLCEMVGADVNFVRKGIGADKRIGFHFIYAGLGYGGSCFPKDIKALIHMGSVWGSETKILKAVDVVNREQRDWFMAKITKHFKNDLLGRRFAVWGLSFKPGTDDVRGAPAIDLVRRLVALGSTVSAFDPVAGETARVELGPVGAVQYMENYYQTLEGVDALILMTEWREFRKPDFDKMKTLMKTPLIFDGRNQYELDEMREKGFHYYSVGRSTVGTIF